MIDYQWPSSFIKKTENKYKILKEKFIIIKGDREFF